MMINFFDNLQFLESYDDTFDGSVYIHSDPHVDHHETENGKVVADNSNSIDYFGPLTFTKYDDGSIDFVGDVEIYKYSGNEFAFRDLPEEVDGKSIYVYGSFEYDTPQSVKLKGMLYEEDTHTKGGTPIREHVVWLGNDVDGKIIHGDIAKFHVESINGQSVDLVLNLPEHVSPYSLFQQAERTELDVDSLDDELIGDDDDLIFDELFMEQER